VTETFVSETREKEKHMKKWFIGWMHRQFREWYAAMKAAQEWTTLTCPFCATPYARPEARFCVACGMALHSSAVSDIFPPLKERDTSGILNVSALPALMYEQNKRLHPDWGPHTRATRAIRSLKGRLNTVD
jgi:hypothetical protein